MTLKPALLEEIKKYYDTGKITIKEGAKLPEYQSRGAAGADLCAFLMNRFF
jgi:dUTPase